MNNRIDRIRTTSGLMFKGEKNYLVRNAMRWKLSFDHEIDRERMQKALDAALSLLKPLGLALICVYPGHAEGERERQELTAYLSALPPQRFNVLHQRFLNAGPGAPECFTVQKNP